MGAASVAVPSKSITFAVMCAPASRSSAALTRTGTVTPGAVRATCLTFSASLTAARRKRCGNVSCAATGSFPGCSRSLWGWGVPVTSSGLLLASPTPAHPHLSVFSGVAARAVPHCCFGLVMLALAVLGGGLYAPVGVGGPHRTTYKPPGFSLDPYKRKSHKYRDDSLLKALAGLFRARRL